MIQVELLLDDYFVSLNLLEQSNHAEEEFVFTLVKCITYC